MAAAAAGGAAAPRRGLGARRPPQRSLGCVCTVYRCPQLESGAGEAVRALPISRRAPSLPLPQCPALPLPLPPPVSVREGRVGPHGARVHDCGRRRAGEVAGRAEGSQGGRQRCSAGRSPMQRPWRPPGGGQPGRSNLRAASLAGGAFLGQSGAPAGRGTARAGPIQLPPSVWRRRRRFPGSCRCSSDRPLAAAANAAAQLVGAIASWGCSYQASLQLMQLSGQSAAPSCSPCSACEPGLPHLCCCTTWLPAGGGGGGYGGGGYGGGSRYGDGGCAALAGVPWAAPRNWRGTMQPARCGWQHASRLIFMHGCSVACPPPRLAVTVAAAAATAAVVAAGAAAAAVAGAHVVPAAVLTFPAMGRLLHWGLAAPGLAALLCAARLAAPCMCAAAIGCSCHTRSAASPCGCSDRGYGGGGDRGYGGGGGCALRLLLAASFSLPP